MIITRRIAIRIAAMIIISVVLQLSFFSYLSFFGTTPDIIPLVVIALGLLGGALVGAACGFATGLLLDSALLGPWGSLPSPCSRSGISPVAIERGQRSRTRWCPRS